MRNPFRDGGLLDKVMPFLLFAYGVGVMLKGVSVIRHGGSVWWIAAGGSILLLACRNAYLLIREMRNKRAP